MKEKKRKMEKGIYRERDGIGGGTNFSKMNYNSDVAELRP